MTNELSAYEQQLNRIAERFAKEVNNNIAAYSESYKKALINQMLPLAAIAIEEMALMYQEGYYNGEDKRPQDLFIMGLTPDKTK